MTNWTETARSQEESFEPWAKKARQAVCILALASLAAPALASCAPRAITETLTPVIEATETALPPTETPILEPSPTPTEIVSPELQRLGAEIEAAGLEGYEIRGNSLYWQETGEELVKVEGDKAIWQLSNGSSYEGEARNLRVVTIDRYVSSQTDIETGVKIEQSNIVDLDETQDLISYGQPFPYVHSIVSQKEVYPVPEAQAGLPETIEDSIRLENIAVLPYYMPKLVKAEKEYIEANGIGDPEHRNIGMYDRRDITYTPFHVRNFSIVSPVYGVSLTRIAKASGSDLYMKGIYGEETLTFPGEPKDIVRLVLHLVTDPEAFSHTHVANDWVGSTYGRIDEPGVLDWLRTRSHNKMWLEAWLLLPQEENKSMISQQGWQEMAELVKQTGGEEEYIFPLAQLEFSMRNGRDDGIWNVSRLDLDRLSEVPMPVYFVAIYKR